MEIDKHQKQSDIWEKEIMYRKETVGLPDRSMAPNPGNRGETPKREKFNWAKSCGEGTFMMVPKEQLNIDEESYQREQVSKSKVLAIARDWDWKLFGAISVVMRSDDSFWVYDGGHRTRAAFFRDDIKSLPCMVFAVSDISEEAKAFVGANTMKSNVSSYHVFKAALAAGEPTAAAVDALMSKYGYRVSQNGTKPTDFRCVHTITKYIKRNAELTEKVFCLLADVSGGDEQISGTAFSAMYFLASQVDEDVFSAAWRKRMMAQSIAGIDHAIRRESHIVGKGGERVAGKALLDLVNKGLRRRLSFRAYN
jgi:hypothetical protein